MRPLKGTKVVQYHKLFDYFFARYGLISIAEIEPLPGIAPASGHILDVINLIKINDVKIILNDVYHSKEPAVLVAAKNDVKMVILPHDVNALPEAKDIILMFYEIIGRLTK